ncbi:MAG TPA: aminotransferase class V-fold PLP-dependent enzyme [Casimicrobiaceae bacterium]|nr:aminotransferase class V-fold PLP-dependent enzyme [Casimicrobiaceae bacterium]HET9748369.1 aminotransferase class V-fold PLP-dependent enzyme [Casimicrobiaceae bacterium]
MPGLLPDVDPDGLLEYSVVFSDRTLNHMSKAFQRMMRDVAATLTRVYHAHAVALVPGSGTFAMEAIARQFATGKRCLVLRNGWFSYRWSQIFEMGSIPSQTRVLQARRAGDGAKAPFAPAPIAEVVAAIEDFRPDLVFAPHVETASGIVLPDGYVRGIARAAHAAGAMFVLDCIASGALWVDMRDLGVDILVSAPQKGWSSAAGFGIVMLGEEARTAIDATTSTSFACDLKKWLSMMEAYERGGHAYHATMPTEAIARLARAAADTESFGFERAKRAQQELGERVRRVLVDHGMPSVAAAGFQAPTVVVSYTDDPGIQSGAKFAQAGLQTAAGVPLQCDEGSDFRTFRVGLFGLDKLGEIDRTVRTLDEALTRITK